MHCSFQTEFHRYHPINLIFSYPTDVRYIHRFPIYIYIIHRYPINSIGYGYLWEISINSINSISKIPHRFLGSPRMLGCSAHLHDLFDLCCARRQVIPWRDHRMVLDFVGNLWVEIYGIYLWEIYGISMGYLWDISVGYSTWNRKEQLRVQYQLLEDWTRAAESVGRSGLKSRGKQGESKQPSEITSPSQKTEVDGGEWADRHRPLRPGCKKSKMNSEYQQKIAEGASQSARRSWLPERWRPKGWQNVKRWLMWCPALRWPWGCSPCRPTKPPVKCGRNYCSKRTAVCRCDAVLCEWSSVRRRRAARARWAWMVMLSSAS